MIGFWRAANYTFSAVVLCFQTISRRCVSSHSLGAVGVQGVTTTLFLLVLPKRSSGSRGAGGSCGEPRTPAGTAALAPQGLLLPLETLIPLCSHAVDPWCLCRARYMSLLLSMQYVDHFGQWWITIYFHWQRNDPYLSYEGNSLLCGNKLHYTTAYCYILISNVLISLLPSTLVNNYNKY